MFDDRLEAALGNRRALADLAGDTEQDSRVVGRRKLVLAPAWRTRTPVSIIPTVGCWSSG